MEPHIAVRSEIIQACRVLTRLGLVQGFGHVSARLDDGTVLITPRKGLGLVKEDELVHLDHAGTKLNNGNPPLEAAMHLAVFAARSDVSAICRTHSRYVNVMGISKLPIEVVHGFGAELRGTVPVHNSPFLVTSGDQGHAVVEALKSAHGIVLPGNGSLVVGESVGDACVKTIFLEESAELQFLSRQLGSVQPWTPEAINARLQSDLPNEPVRAWEFYRTTYGLDN
ncbi:MAG: class II aldolase/adducin family protein [Acidimicrobiaceae bacterium]|nr:class II aldolase/adducin family protein [Acidimicrobiaceae bacterium]